MFFFFNAYFVAERKFLKKNYLFKFKLNAVSH